MKIITNQTLIQKRKRIGQITTFASLGILGIGFFLSFKPETLSYSFIALIVGFLISQIGIYYTNRWGRTPRPDEMINKALKGLDDKFKLYHYTSPVPHLLIGPPGIWVLLPYHVRGTITYNTKRDRWQQKGGNLYMKIFAQESLGKPEVEINSYIEDLEKFLQNEMANNQTADSAKELPAINAALIFTHDKVEIDAPDAPIAALTTDKLKEFMRKQTKSSQLSIEQVNEIQDILPKEDK